MARILTGTVVSDKSDKTIIVSVETRKTHPIYKKQYMESKRFAAHDEKNQAHVGDKVSIVECRPVSASKHFMLSKIEAKAGIAHTEEIIEAEELASKPASKKKLETSPSEVSSKVLESKE